VVGVSYGRWGYEKRPVQKRPAPLCSWPEGCKRKTWDVSGRCPAHQAAVAAAGGVGVAAAGGAVAVAAGGDPLGGQLTEAEKILELLEWGGEREAVALAAAGVTADDWPQWAAAFKGFGQADQIYWAATHGVTPDMLPVLVELSDDYKGLARFVKNPYSGMFDREMDWAAVHAWAEGAPSLPPVTVDRYVGMGLVPGEDPAAAMLAGGVSAHMIGGWVDGGYGTAAAVGWVHAGCTRVDADILTKAGYGPGDAAAALAALDGDYLTGERRSVRVLAAAAGLDNETVAKYDSAGVHSVEDAAQLAAAGVTPTVYRKWRKGRLGRSGCDLDPGNIVSQVKAGVSPGDAMVYAEVGVHQADWPALTSAGGTGDNLFAVLADFDDGAWRVEMARRGDVPPAVLAHIATDQGRSPVGALRQVAAHEATPPEALSVLAGVHGENDERAVRLNVAMHSSTPAEALGRLAADTDPHVRRRATENPNCPKAGKSAAGLLAD